MSYTRLSLEERHTIHILLREQYSIRGIARYLHRSPSTISREVKRGTIKQLHDTTFVYEYDYSFAEKMARFYDEARGRKLKIGHDHKSANLLTKLVKQGYSPYAALQIANQQQRLSTRISLTTFYRYVKKGVLNIDEADLPYGFYKTREKQDEFSERRDVHRTSLKHISIGKRPKSVLSRVEFGHWEGDTVVGTKGSKKVFMTLVERKSRWLIALLLNDRKASSIAQGFDFIEYQFGKDMFNRIFKSITFDNGKEFEDLDQLQLSVFPQNRSPGNIGGRLGHIYYAHPYCSCERGSNENIHRFLRRKWAKKTDFSSVDVHELEKYVSWINDYPRKLFDGASANQIFQQELALIA